MSSLVYLKSKDGETVYVYVNEKGEDGKYSRRCIGHLDPLSGEILPNRHRASESNAHVRSYGINMLLRNISDSIGLTDALMVTFTDTWDSILSCAFYCLSEDTPVTEMEQWMEFNETPRMWPLKMDDLIRIMKMISQDDIDSFFRVWKKRAGDEQFVISMLSVSSTIEKSSKRDFEKLFSTDFEICYGKDSELPIGYLYHPTGFSSAFEMFSASDRFDWVEGDNCEYVVEVSQTRSTGLESIMPLGVRNTTEIPSEDSLFRRMISEHQVSGVMDAPRVSTIPYKYGGRNRYIHLYYDPEKAEVEISRFLNIIEMCRYELTKGQYVPSHSTIYSKYFLFRSRKDVELNSDAIMAVTSPAGVRMDISNHIEDPVEVNKWFRHNDAAKKIQAKIMNDMDLVSMKLYIQSNFFSRVFIQFIALILNNALEDRMRKSGLADLTVHSVLYSMKRMIRVNLDNRKNPLMSDMDDVQERIMESLFVRMS